MKEAIVGYITALIDTHHTEAEKLKKASNQCNYKELEKLKKLKNESSCNEAFAEELEHLLDFVIDIPEDENIPESCSGQGAKNITVNMVNPEDLPPKVKKILETIAKQQDYK